MDSWVLNLTRSVKYSDADRAEIQRQLTEQYISDYTATWRAGMDNLNIRNFESIGQLTGAGAGYQRRPAFAAGANRAA